MYINVRINTQTERGKQLIKQLRRYPKTVKFDNPTESGVVPEGYMTSGEFRKTAMEDTVKFCKENGLL
ncbi:MAG TPA: hypothetical protein GXX42_12510 [Petrimonas sp.]|uniref:Uncharacterized protein n=1 Tax=bioreactor metagenome TaxID=1076179 RepID=A0A645DJ70_9ZZZZ|nr:hypothetical protein [Petrimonas sp.]OJV35797.1 MAG: hypothetical protein BGO33_14580 [Bacteroidia bacterium 43-41]MEA4950874.1 hypothetical protein [Petrimonas sp.]MEA4979282.1 hypothetical protein [Petrimonas sp.]MEA5044018.1 hypothetical protein [Petrimonas sp.]